MSKFPWLEKGRCRMFSDTINWALYGKIEDEDLIVNSGFNCYYGDLFGSGEETFPRHMAHRSIEFQRKNIEVNRAHVESVHNAGMKYIYYSSSCTFDATFFDDETKQKFGCVFKTNEIAFGTPNRLYACLNSEEWLQFQIEKSVMLVNELDFDGVFFDNLFFLIPCQCENCKRKYKEMTGRDLEETVRYISMQDSDEKVHNKGVTLEDTQVLKADKALYELYLEYYEFRRICTTDFLRRYREGVDARIHKDFAVIANTCMYLGEMVDLYKKTPGLLDCYYSENGYTFPPETNMFTYKVGNAIAPDSKKSVVMVTRVLEGMPTSAMMKGALAEGMANSGMCTPWGFFLKESDTLKRETVRYIRFQEREEELLARQENIADVAIVYPVQMVVLKKLLGDEAQYVNPGAQIASRMLCDLNIPHDVLFADDPITDEQLKKYKMFIFPEADMLSEENFKAMERFAAAGGTVLATGRSFTLDENFNARERKLEGENVYLVEKPFDRDYATVRLTENYEKILKDEHAALIRKINPSKLIETTAGALTFITVTGSASETLLHFVNYNSNRGPYAMRGIPDHNIYTKVQAKGISEVLYMTPDDRGELHRLDFKTDGEFVEFTLPRLDIYTIVILR